METILVVEDDVDIRELERYTLSSLGYMVLEAEHGAQALDLLKSHHIDLMVLDIMMPVLDGLSTIKSVRYQLNNPVPIIVVSARGEESDIITALELGADDYLSKPFSAKVLASKIRAVLRRTQEMEQQHPMLEADGLIMDQQKHQCMLDGEEIELTATEFALLYLLASNPEQVFTRNQIITKVKGDDYPVTDRSIDVQIATLRKKLGSYGTRIKTIWGIGYTYKN
ncbi:response regulator transcription factor [Sphaerochaeta sp. S2]|uniref:response regulator transcription factor n=1 Tax=Sphaerochaeta sp. S2 TaxID=2798868 RepID=UPI0018E92E32|nr:response regulator transcription factor [Sphaerochaeta sp. S2]MBJ2357429.1 response regulator transcription factor [Sphaerochaeta sp. S2]